VERVFTLDHVYETPDGVDEVKRIGIYTSIAEAELAMERLKDQQGFVDRPNDFQINEVKLDRDGWTEGFISAADA
jgi:hypothetical protein